MKEANKTGVLSLVQGAKSVKKGLPLSSSNRLSSHTRSLHVSIQKRDGEASGPQRIQAPEEDHCHRLMSLGEKVGSLAHDIRNPLSSIEWFATLLGREQYDQSERQELAKQCIQAVRSLDHLVSNILMFSAPLDAQPETIEIKALLDAVELLAMYPLRNKQLTIHRHQEKHLTFIKGHEALLKQVLLNLLINAIHASDQGRAIDFHCQSTTRILHNKENPSVVQGVVLRICDYGCGMSKEELSQIFRPFFSKRKGGTGLGLSIVKRIVQVHRGLIDITSQEGKGTTVDLFFPQ